MPIIQATTAHYGKMSSIIRFSNINGCIGALRASCSYVISCTQQKIRHFLLSAKLSFLNTNISHIALFLRHVMHAPDPVF